MSALDRQQGIVNAMLAALRADPQLGALVGKRVYDAPPGRAALPEITVKLVSASDGSTADTDAQVLVFDLDVWDRYAAGASLAGPRALMGHVRRILHMQVVPVTGCALITLRCTGAHGPVRDPDNVALHGTVTVTALAGHEAAFP